MQFKTAGYINAEMSGGISMTVKKRLTQSNIIMILVPVVITSLIIACCACGAYIFMRGRSGIGFEESADFQKTVVTASEEFHEMFEHGTESKKQRISSLAGIINKESMFLIVYEDGMEFYKSGNALLQNHSAEKSAAQLGNNAFLSTDLIQLYHYETVSENIKYDLYIYNTAVADNGRALKAVAAVSAAVIVAAIALSLFFTNRFLIKFVFKKIEGPLTLLSKGVEEISRGNLDYRLEYTENDEFLPVCNSFNDMAERLKKSVELTKKNEENRKELLLDISHDLRTPLTAIQAYVEGLIDGVAQTPEMQKKYLETIKRKTTDIDKMVSSLFAYSKLDMEEFEPKIASIDIYKFLSDTVGGMRDEYEKSGLNILISKCDGITVKADADLLKRVTVNLLENSLKYKTKPVGNMLISVLTSNKKAFIKFEDDGPGVDDDKLEKIFNVFYRTDEARSNTGGGSGIGLAFVKKAVESMNGTVHAERSSLGGLAIIIEAETEEA